MIFYLRIWHKFFFALVQDSDVEEGWSITTPPEAEENFRRPERPVVQVRRQPCRGHVHHLVIVRNIFCQTRKDHLEIKIKAIFSWCAPIPRTDHARRKGFRGEQT